jgi:hypothetical protein
MFDLASRETRWVQSRAGRLGIANAIVDTAHELTITTRTPNGSLSRRVEHYRADGTLAWERRWPMSSPDLAGETYDGTLNVDSQGNLSLLLVDYNEHSRLFRMSRDGEQLFAREYDSYQEPASDSSSSQLPTVVSMSSGTIIYSPIMVTDEELGEPTSAHTIVVVSPDGERCTRHALRRPGYATYLRLMAQDDRLYFSTPGGFGGLELPLDVLP